MRCDVMLCALALATLSKQGATLKCYKCSTASDPKCDDPVGHGLTSVECTTPEPVLFPDQKTNTTWACGTATFVGGNKSTLLRDCSASGKGELDLCTNNVTSTERQHLVHCVQHTCGEDRCNNHVTNVITPDNTTGATTEATTLVAKTNAATGTLNETTTLATTSAPTDASSEDCSIVILKTLLIIVVIVHLVGGLALLAVYFTRRRRH